MTTVLIDASGLHSGGGVQVAASFLDELARFIMNKDADATWPSSLTVEASTAVVAEIATSTAKVLRCRTIDRKPAQFNRWIPLPPTFDVSFVIFGPEYGTPRAKRRVVGFADVTSILPRPPSLPALRGRALVRALIRKHVSRLLHCRADVLVVETQAAARTLACQFGNALPNVEVVQNTVNGIFNQPDRWSALAVPLPKVSELVRICYVARAYEHKNHAILASVVRKAAERYKRQLSFVVTLNDTEWNSLTVEQRYGLTNIGPLHVSQVPTLLLACDAVIFPSLLEVYSAAPVEAMLMGKLLFASDRDFIRDTCGEAPVYFDPTSADDIARSICETVATPQTVTAHIFEGKLLAASLITPADRAKRYLKILREQTQTAA